MRPRLLHLGYGTDAQTGRGEYNGFNEAEAFTPRILRLAEEQTRGAGLCFNEAEAFTPRIPALKELQRMSPFELQ